MKLIIDIPEENYKLICSDGRPFLDSYKWIKNGTPIPDNATVCDIEQIRAEIEQYEVECTLIIPINDRTCKRCTFDTFKNIYQIIDRYTKGE